MLLFERFRQLLRRLFGDAAEEPAPAPRTTTYAARTGLVEITAPPTCAESQAAVEKAHHQFIVEHWPRLAAAAYTGFRRHGVGVVVIEQRSCRAEHPFDQHALAYATGTGRWTSSLPPHSAAPGWLEDQFQTYEPLEAGLFLFRGGAADAPRPYRAEGTLTPPEALRQIRAPFN